MKTMKNSPTIRTIITTLLLVGILFNGLGLCFLWSYTRLPIVKEARSRYLDSPGAYYPNISVDSDREYFQKELGSELSRYKTQEEKVRFILRWTMSQFSRIESFSTQSSQDLVQQGRSGRGAICGGMAQVFRDALLSSGIPARTVQFQRNPFDLFDTHVSVEVWLDGEWRLFDPTFHIALRQGGEYVGAMKARNSLLNGKAPAPEVVFLGEVNYPARIENNYISLPFYFDNVYFNTERTSEFLRPWPKFAAARRWVNYYPSDSAPASNSAQEFYRALFLIFVIIFPIANSISFASAALLYLSAHCRWLSFRAVRIWPKAGGRTLDATPGTRIAIALRNLSLKIRRIP